MRFQCYECDRDFEEPDFIIEKHGLENPPYEKIAVCPYCKSYFEEMYECKICGGHYTLDEIANGVCCECISKHTTLDNCIKFGDRYKDKVEVNGLVAWLISNDKINEILINEIRKATEIIPIELSGFIAESTYEFAEQIIKDKENF